LDTRFHRGELAFDRFFGDAGPPRRGAFYAWKVLPADLATKGGVRCDASGRGLRGDGNVLPGSYGAGNTMASWTNHCYPGPGVPIGTCVVFVALAGRDMIGQ
jgi:3-oxosteroid 1-dehydrogenase